MSVQILDCTLRDGGYINDWRFGNSCIHSIAQKLGDARIDIIECGFLREIPYDPETAVFNDIAQIAEVIAPRREGCMYVAMIAIGDIDPDRITPRRADSIDGIRMTFHQHEWDETFEVAQNLKDKGYEVFIQPVGTTSYSDKLLLELVERVNAFHPYAFYLVDTLGSMYKDDLLHMYRMVDKNLADGIRLGFHSHNNLQLAFSNAQELIGANRYRDLIVDSSVFGMGRGAGNLCTELIAHYLNANEGAHYDVLPLLEIVDEHLADITLSPAWGYKVPYFLAAVKDCHPNYADDLINRQTITIKSTALLLDRIPQEERTLYNKKLIAQLYAQYQQNLIDDTENIRALGEKLGGRNVVVLGSGATLSTHIDEIEGYIRDKEAVVISVNFMPARPKPDMLFVSNAKRFKPLARAAGFPALPVIATSNLAQYEGSGKTILVNYQDYATPEGDNAGAMLTRLLARLGAQSVGLAGFDGFSAEVSRNYYNDDAALKEQKELFDEKNRVIKAQFDAIRQTFPVTFITPSAYE